MNISTSTFLALIAVLVGLLIIQKKYQIKRLFSFGISLALIAASLVLFYGKHQFLVSSIRTEGTITDTYIAEGTEFTAHCFRATFKDKQGKSHTVGTGICSSKPMYAVGDRVAIAYPEAAPSKGVVLSAPVIYLWPIALGLLGLMLLGLESYQTFMGRKQTAA